MVRQSGRSGTGMIVPLFGPPWIVSAACVPLAIGRHTSPEAESLTDRRTHMAGFYTKWHSLYSIATEGTSGLPGNTPRGP